MKSLTLGSVLLGCLFTNAIASASEPEQICYQVKFLEFQGLAWRQNFHDDLELVSRKGKTSVWTLSEPQIKAFTEAAGSVVTSPTVTTFEDANAFVRVNSTHLYDLKNLKRVSSPVHKPPATKSDLDQIKEGTTVEVTGRTLEQGILAKVKVDNVHLTGLETVTLHAKSGSPAGSYQIPFFHEAHVEGEWLAPIDGAIVIGLGCEKTGPHGTLTERVVLLAPKRILLEVEEECAAPIFPAPTTQNDQRVSTPSADHVVIHQQRPKASDEQPTMLAPVVRGVIMTPEGEKFAIWTVKSDDSNPVVKRGTATSEAPACHSTGKVDGLAGDLIRELGMLENERIGVNFDFALAPSRSTPGDLLDKAIGFFTALVTPTYVPVQNITQSPRVDTSLKQASMDRGKGFDFDIDLPPGMVEKISEALEKITVAPKSPILPSRNLPLAIDAQGRLFSLPPLPEDAPCPDAFDADGKPVATPQAGQIVILSPGDHVNKTRFSTDSQAKLGLKMHDQTKDTTKPTQVFDAQAKLDSGKLARLETQTILVPLGNGIMIEIQAKLVPESK